jgi:hypothetical protein
MIDTAYTQSQYHPPEIDHAYGPNIHLLDDPLAWSLLTRACSPDAVQPQFGHLVSMLYAGLSAAVLGAELPRVRVDVPTRMASTHREAVYRGLAIDRRVKAVTVDKRIHAGCAENRATATQNASDRFAIESCGAILHQAFPAVPDAYDLHVVLYCPTNDTADHSVEPRTVASGGEHSYDRHISSSYKGPHLWDRGSGIQAIGDRVSARQSATAATYN